MARITKTERHYGYWHCGHCGSEISGKYAKCLSCAAPVPKPKGRQKSVYYLKSRSEPVTAPSEQALMSAGPDWVCDHCTASNSDLLKFCDSCGNKRDEADYVRETVRYGRGEQVPSTHDETFVPEPPAPKKPNRKPLYILAGVVAVLAVAAYFLFFRPHSENVKVSSFSWDRAIQIEALKTFTEQDWHIPSGGRERSRTTKFHHNDQVLDHYETRMVTKTRDVYDGEETWTETVDNGDGTFTTETHSRPVYRSESYTEQEEVPVYRDVPVYQDWYTYDIDRWVEDRVRKSKGGDHEPIWAEYVLKDLERVGEKTESYWVVVTTTERKENRKYDLELPYAQWESLAIGQEATLKFKGLGKVVGLE